MAGEQGEAGRGRGMQPGKDRSRHWERKAGEGGGTETGDVPTGLGGDREGAEGGRGEAPGRKGSRERGEAGGCTKSRGNMRRG